VKKIFLLAAAIPYNLLMSEYSFLKAQLSSWFKTSWSACCR